MKKLNSLVLKAIELNPRFQEHCYSIISQTFKKNPLPLEFQTLEPVFSSVNEEISHLERNWGVNIESSPDSFRYSLKNKNSDKFFTQKYPILINNIDEVDVESLDAEHLLISVPTEVYTSAQRQIILDKIKLQIGNIEIHKKYAHWDKQIDLFYSLDTNHKKHSSDILNAMTKCDENGVEIDTEYKELNPKFIESNWRKAIDLVVNCSWRKVFYFEDGRRADQHWKFHTETEMKDIYNNYRPINFKAL
ncbi:MAG: hypothetical protein KC493_17010 [Bacteriovoracaceae bacterium]|nr:hypothetical protein [Bacteriovoracaceae bacterium]